MTRQRILDDAVNGFNFTQIEKELLAEIEGLIKKLSIENGKITYTQKNINLVNDIEAKIKKIVGQSKYRSQVNDYLKNFEQITVAAKQEQRDNDVKIGKLKFSDIQKTSIDMTVNAMLGTGLDVNFVQPVKDIVFNSIVGGASVADAELQLKNTIMGDADRQGRLTRYATQIARDSIYGYDGRVQSLIANELGMNAYSYEGSIIVDSRPQCVRWVEEFDGVLLFTELEKEIAWAYDNGSGMKPDTTPENFAVNRGGWNCRHTVTAVFEEDLQGVKTMREEAESPPQETKEQPKTQVEFSHSFVNDKGNKIDQYQLTNGMGGYIRVEHYPDGFVITNIILDERVRGMGIATKFYKKINQQSIKETGKTLQSIKPDETGLIELSSQGKALWESLIRKGFAKKIGENRYRFIKK